MNLREQHPTGARLQAEFLQSLPEHVTRLRELARNLEDAASPAQARDQLGQRISELRHSAEVFGIPVVGAAVATLADSLDASTGDSDLVDRDQWDNALDRLAAIAAQHARGDALAIASRVQPLSGARADGRVLVVVDDDALARNIVLMLQDHGFRTDQIPVRDSQAPQSPDDDPYTAVVLCAGVVMPGTVITNDFAGCLAPGHARLPVLAVAREWNPGARLDAVRQGVARCLDYPLDGDTLIEQLVQIGGVITESDYRVLLIAGAEREGVERTLLDAGYRVERAEEPDRLVEVMDELDPEVAILDVESLDCSALEVAAVLRTRQSGGSIPLVILTADASRTNALMTLHPGVCGVLLKPLEASRVLAVVTNRARQLREMDSVSRSYRETLYEREREHLAVNEHALVSIADARGGIVYANRRFAEVSGYMVEELLGQNHRVVKSGQHPPHFYTRMWETISAGQVWQGEICNRARDGSLYWVDTTIVPYLDAEGVPYQFVSIRTEITTVKRQEQRQRSSQIFANMGTWEWTPDQERLEWSERIPPLLGYRDGAVEPTVTNFMHAVHPEDRDRMRNAISSSLRRGAHFELEHRVVWPDGSEHWLLQRGDVVRDADGRVLYMLGVMQDITKRKHSELTLSELSTRLLEAQRLARLGHWEYEVRSDRMTWSKVIYEMFQMNAGNGHLAREDYQRLAHPDDQTRVQAFEAVLSDSGHGELTHRVQLPDGTVRYVHLIATATFDDGGDVVRLSGTLQDLTELHEAQDRLTLFGRIIESAEQGIAVVDREGCFVYVNPAALELVGYRLDEMVGRSFREMGIIPEEAREESQEIDRVLAEGGVWTGLLPHRCANGAVFVTASTISVVRDEHGDPQYGFNIFSDYTDELRRREELRQARDAAERANRAKSEFLSSMSHELRTPMNAVLGFAQLLERDSGLGERQHSHATEIRRAGSHLLDLINEVLDLARIEAGRLKIDPQPVFVAPVVADCLSLTRTLAEEQAVRCEAEVADDVQVLADPVRLKQVLLNLVGNAIKYNRSGGKIRVGVTLQSDVVEIAVSDTGPGIAPEDQARLFEPFERLHADGGRVEGAGVGLAVSHSLVEMMGGELAVESEQGVGSRFWFRLPRAGTEPHVMDDPTAESGVDKDPRVLFIEANPEHLGRLRTLFEGQAGLQPLFASSAVEGLDLALRHVPALVVLALDLPVMDGFQVLRALQADPALASIPVVAVGGAEDSERIERARHASFRRVLTRPASAGDLAALLDDLAIGQR